MNDFELINLTLDEIRKQAYLLYENGRYLEEHCKTAYDKNQIKEHSEAFRFKLRDILGDIAEYNNATNAITEVDTAMSKLPFDLIYERKIEADFESINTITSNRDLTGNLNRMFPHKNLNEDDMGLY